MTGYAMVTSAGEIALSVELRGVNGRFLDLSFRLPEEFRSQEMKLRELLRANILRGKIECRVLWRHDQSSQTTAPNPEVLAQLSQQLDALNKALPNLAAPTAADFLAMPGLFGQALDFEALHPRLMQAAEQAVEEFIASRVAEAERIKTMLTERLNAISNIADSLRERVPELTAAFETKLHDRLAAAFESLPDQPISTEETMARVRQEVSAYGLRADVSEELDRLISHVTECQTQLKGAGPVGKRLDFLMQELNREANTLGSKASAIDLTQAAVDLKVLIEQIREQVQNLE
jgi:uncharacterized protein (TIGR00255 family)